MWKKTWSLEKQHCIFSVHLPVQLLFDGQVLEAFWQPIRIHKSAINTTLLQEKQWLILMSLLSQQTVAVARKVSAVQTHPTQTHTSTEIHSHKVLQLRRDTLIPPLCAWTHTQVLGQRHLHTRTHSQAWADKNARIQTHPRESYSKWTSQLSKVLTSIRHAYTVWLPTDSESHLSVRASAKQFQREARHFLHFCIYSELVSEPNSLALFQIVSTHAVYSNCENCETICSYWMTLLQLIYLHETVVMQVHADEQHPLKSHLGIWGDCKKLGSVISTKLWDSSSLSSDWKAAVAYKKNKP